MRTIAIISSKGGAGKTTIAVHLAVAAMHRGMRPILVDLDPQQSASYWGELRGDMPPDVMSEHAARLDRTLPVLAREHDLAIIDTAAGSEGVALRAAQQSDLILIPVRPATFDVAALAASLGIARLAARPALVILNAAPPRGERVIADARFAIEKAGGTVAKIALRQRIAYQHCLGAGWVAAEHDPTGQAAAEVRALAWSILRTPKETSHGS